MNELLPKLVDSAIIWLGVMLVASLCSAALYPAFRRPCLRCGPESMSLSLLVWGMLPLLVATVVTLLVMTPSLSAALVPSHCHDDNCQPHSPTVGINSALGIGMIAATSALLLALGGICIRMLVRLKRHLGTLRLLSRENRGEEFLILDSDHTIAWCAGLWAPRIYLSRGLLARLDPEQKRAVLAHEHGHRLRRDNLRALCLQLSTLSWPRKLRGLLLADFRCSTEQSCDQLAISAVGNPGIVREAIRVLAHGPAGLAERGAQFFGSAELSRRLQGLQEARAGTIDTYKVATALTLMCLIQTALLTGAAHRSYEWLL